MKRSFIIAGLLFFFLICKKGSSSREIYSYKNIDVTCDDSSVKKFPNSSDSDILICEIPFEPDINLEEFKKYLQDNLVPDSASLDTIPSGSYTTIIEFVMDENGNIPEASIQKDPGYGLGRKARDVILHYKRKDIFSVKYTGKNKYYKRQPIIFIVEEEESKAPLQLNSILWQEQSAQQPPSL